MTKLRWGILSTGTIATKFAQTLAGMKDEAIFAGVASRDAEKAKAFAQQHGALNYFGSYEELAASTEIDAVYVATPNRFHFENSMLCLEAGKHVLCEKPFTINATQAKTLYHTAKANNLMIMDALWTMHLPIYHQIRKTVAEGAIGNVKHIRAEFGFAPSGARKDFKMDHSVGGGSLLDVGIYPIVLTASLLGVNPSSIKSHLNICEYGTDDLATMILTYPNGATAALSSAIGTKMPTEGVIFGSEGLIRLPSFLSATKMIVEPLEGEPVEYDLPLDINGFEYQIRDFAACISNGTHESGTVPMAFSLGVIKILDSIRESCGFKYSFE